jgi:chaperonin GroEL (HSP60 family)
VEEGIVPGGGVALLRAGEGIDKLELTGDDAIGAKIVARAIEEPLRQLAANAGEEGAMIVQNVKAKKGAVGYNAETNEYEDLLKAGVIDPAGHAYRAAERRQRRRAPADHRSPHRRTPENRQGPAGGPGGRDTKPR